MVFRPKVRRKWDINPAERIVPVKKIYKRKAEKDKYGKEIREEIGQEVLDTPDTEEYYNPYGWEM
jgi:hypothetical protein